MDEYGLSHHHIQCLKKIVEAHLQQGEVVLYGSRAKGTQRSYSDVDLVVKKAVPHESTLMEVIRAEITDSDFPYLCDVQLFEKICNQELMAHIERVGIKLFRIGKYSGDDEGGSVHQ